MDAIFVNLAWGDNVQKSSKYTLSKLKPSIETAIIQALDLSPNLMIYLPRNVDIHELVNILSVHHS